MKWRRIIYIFLWILSLIGISVFGGTISYGFFWGLTIIPVIILLYLFLVYMQFRVYQEIESRTIVCKQPMPYYFKLKNETFYGFASLSVHLYSKFSYVTDMRDEDEYELLPGDEYTYHTQIVCKYRGEYPIGVKEIVVTDMFGLFRFRYKNEGKIEALVYPRIIHKDELKSLEEMINNNHQETIYEQVEQDVVTREYIPGDALKRIHWKVSAKEQKLKTRNMIGERRHRIALLFDTQRYSKNIQDYLPLENQILEAVLALSVLLAKKNISHSVIYHMQGIRSRKIEGIGQFESLYEEIAHLCFQEEYRLDLALEWLLEEHLHNKVQDLLLVAHEIDEKMFKELQILSLEGVGIILYLITNQDVQEYLNQSYSNLQVIVLSPESDLEERL